MACTNIYLVFAMCDTWPPQEPWDIQGYTFSCCVLAKCQHCYPSEQLELALLRTSCVQQCHVLHVERSAIFGYETCAANAMLHLAKAKYSPPPFVAQG